MRTIGVITHSMTGWDPFLSTKVLTSLFSSIRFLFTVAAKIKVRYVWPYIGPVGAKGIRVGAKIVVNEPDLGM